MASYMYLYYLIVHDVTVTFGVVIVLGIIWLVVRAFTDQLRGCKGRTH